jgi:CheY-like chemotaxis protein
LILLDLHLPDMGGGEVLRRLQAEPDTRGIPVAVLSADATASQRQRLMDAGAVAYLTKPLDLQALLALLDERLSAGRARHHDGT